MIKIGLYLLSSVSVLLCCSPHGRATDNADAPMPIFPREKLPTVTVPMKPAYTKPGNEPPAKTLVLTTSYFASEKNPKHAFQEACEQQGAHFNEPAFYYRKACILIQLKSYSRAEQELKNLIADIPNNSDYHLARAFCYYKMKNKTAADDEINTARFHNPRLPENIEIGNE